MNFLNQFRAARRVSTPLIAILTPDYASTIEAINGTTNRKYPSIRWDIVGGLTGMNEPGKSFMIELGIEPSASINPTEALQISQQLPRGSVLFFLGAHRFIANESVAQAIWNLRDAFKSDRRTLILLAPELELPIELKQDVVVLEESLPDDEALQKIIQEVCKAVAEDSKEFLADSINSAINATRGLSAFAVEQVVAMSLTRDGLDTEALWERKRRTIEQTRGLKVWKGGESFKDIGGVENIKDFLGKILHGAAAPRSVIFIDEIEKMLAGAAGGQDSSGVSQDFLGQLLSYMQDRGCVGMIFVGPPGSAKSMVAKAAGNEGNIPTIALDLGGMKGSLLGESEQALRSALRIIDAVNGEGSALWIATCNKLADLPPELRRRFRLGTFFFDLPTEEEREKIWQIYLKRRCSQPPLPDDRGWTGAEIASCCDIAWRLNCGLTEAAAYIVPIAKSAAESIERLRQQANGRFISASYSGVYRMAEGPEKSKRTISLEDD